MTASRLELPDVSVSKVVEQHPLLAEDITNIETYEENQFTHQEIVITLPVNDVFKSIIDHKDL